MDPQCCFEGLGAPIDCPGLTSGLPSGLNRGKKSLPACWWQASLACMNPEAKIKSTRRLLVAVILTGLVLGVFGALIGMGIPGLIISIAGWIAVIAGIAWLLTTHLQRSTAASRPGSWRPGDDTQ